MDYMTKSTTRIDLRSLAVLFRSLFDIPQNGPFPVLEILDKLPDVELFKGTTVLIVDDNKLLPGIPAQCTPITDESFLIEIKQSVYDGAYHHNIGAYRAHILHEICHIFLYKVGFKPILTRQFADNELPAYCSVEWQAKALCGEILMPYKETENMSGKDIQTKYMVSPSAAKERMKY